MSVSDCDMAADAARKGLRAAVEVKVLALSAPPRVSVALELPENGAVWRRERWTRVRGALVEHNTMYVPRRLLSGDVIKQDHLTDADLYDALRGPGLVSLAFREVVLVRFITENERAVMTGTGGQVVEVTRTAHAGERPMAVQYAVMPPDKCELTYEWEQ